MSIFSVSELLPQFFLMPLNWLMIQCIKRTKLTCTTVDKDFYLMNWCHIHLWCHNFMQLPSLGLIWYLWLKLPVSVIGVLLILRVIIWWCCFSVSRHHEEWMDQALKIHLLFCEKNCGRMIFLWSLNFTNWICSLFFHVILVWKMPVGM